MPVTGVAPVAGVAPAANIEAALPANPVVPATPAPVAGVAPVARAAPPAMPPTSGPALSCTPDWLNRPLLTERPAMPVLATMLTVVLAVTGAAAVFLVCALSQLLVPWQPLQSVPVW